MKKFNRIMLIAVLCIFFISTAHAGQKINQNVNLGGSRQATWYLPDTTADGWVFLQHGFNRNKSNMDDLATHLMDNGLMVLTVNCSVKYGNASLASDVADDLIDNPPTPPNGFVLPNTMVLSGHSAGGLFVTYIGSRLVDRSYTALRGLILLDPVDANNGMDPNMQAVIDFGRPVLAILANSSSCNSSNNALQPLRNLSNPFVGIRLTDNSKHTDAEGDSTGGILTWLCGSPKAHNMSYLQDFTSHWAIDMVTGSQASEYYPGGTQIQNLININDGELIKELNTQECGNGIIEDGEECDGGGCCDINCYFVSAGTQCRDATGECDLSEECTGVDADCPTDVFKPGGTSCSIGVCQNNQCTDDTILPMADFTFTTSELNVTFTDGSSDTDGTIVSRSWAFGDGETSTKTNPGHTYTSLGTYTVTLTVTDDNGATDSITKDVTVGLSGPTELQNDTSVSNLSAPKGEELHFVLNVPEGSSNLAFVMSGGTGDADIYVRHGAPPNTSTYDYHPYKNGNKETVNVPAPDSGAWYVMIQAYNSFSGVSLTGSF